MSAIISQVSYQVFLYCVFTFFLIASVFSFVVGISIASRNAAMLRLFKFMNTSFSLRKAMKPISLPHFIEPDLLRHPERIGLVLIIGSSLSIFLLMDIERRELQPIFLGMFSYFSALALADYTKWLLLLGNGICAAIGFLLLFYPQQVSRIEGYTDRWYSLRKRTRPLEIQHMAVDHWVLAHPTVSGISLSIMSLGSFFSMYAQL